jgi:uncharacterized membrane protein
VARQNTKVGNSVDEDVMASWIGIGAGFGVALGVVYGNIALGTGLGAALGAIIGGIEQARVSKRDEPKAL